MKLFIITGAGKGLGKSISTLLRKDENVIVDISRSSTDFPCDLSSTKLIPQVVTKILTIHASSSFTHITLINNAGMVEPISPLGQLINEEITINLTVNLLAPIILSNEFLKQTKNYEGKLKIVNISSGVARSPKESWSTYSASKGGLENFSACLAKEQEERCEVFCCDPGLMDTQMQATIRNSNKTDFPDIERFQNFKNNGLLVSPDQVASRVLSEANIC